MAHNGAHTVYRKQENYMSMYYFAQLYTLFFFSTSEKVIHDAFKVYGIGLGEIRKDGKGTKSTG